MSAAILPCCSAVRLALLVSLRLARRSGTLANWAQSLTTKASFESLMSSVGNRRNYSTR